VLNLLLIVVTFGFAAPIVWLVYGLMGNEIHRNALYKKGYLTRAQWDERNPSRRIADAAAKTLEREAAAAAATKAAQAALTSRPQVSVADEIRKLADLRLGGFLTDDEFAQQKAALLGGRAVSSTPEFRASVNGGGNGQSSPDLLAKYGISFDGNKYRYTTCRFDSPAEALAYAQMVEPKQA
jgi:hypothetical protein